jgi:hypothetical protein
MPLLLILHPSEGNIYSEKILDARCTSNHRHFYLTPSVHLSTARLTREDSGARANVLEAGVVDRLLEQWVAKLVRTGELHTRRVRAASTSDLDLEARDVWLRVLGASVQGEGFSADEVVAGSERLGDDKGALSAVGVENLGAP